MLISSFRAGPCDFIFGTPLLQPRKLGHPRLIGVTGTFLSKLPLRKVIYFNELKAYCLATY
jgi:hypothetical protein